MAKAAKNDAEVAFLRSQLRKPETQQEPHRSASLQPYSSRGIRIGPDRSANSRRPKANRAKDRDLSATFAGRPTSFRTAMENAKDGRSGYAPAVQTNEWPLEFAENRKNRKCGACPNESLHSLSGNRRSNKTSTCVRLAVQTAVVPTLSWASTRYCRTNTCWFLAADFDGEQWAEDALAFIETCRARDVPAALERSAIGSGWARVDFFFATGSCSKARQPGAALMTETMERRPEIDFASLRSLLSKSRLYACRRIR